VHLRKLYLRKLHMRNKLRQRRLRSGARGHHHDHRYHHDNDDDDNGGTGGAGAGADLGQSGCNFSVAAATCAHCRLYSGVAAAHVGLWHVRRGARGEADGSSRARVHAALQVPKSSDVWWTVEFTVNEGKLADFKSVIAEIAGYERGIPVSLPSLPIAHSDCLKL